MQKKLMVFGLAFLLAGHIQAASFPETVAEFVDELCGRVLQEKIEKAEAALANCKESCSTNASQLEKTTSQLAIIQAYDKSLLARFILGMGIDKVVRSSVDCSSCSKTVTSLATQLAINYLIFDRGLLRHQRAQRTWSDAAWFALKASAVYLSAQLANKKIAKYFSSPDENAAEAVATKAS